MATVEKALSIVTVMAHSWNVSLEEVEKAWKLEQLAGSSSRTQATTLGMFPLILTVLTRDYSTPPITNPGNIPTPHPFKKASAAAKQSC